MTPDVPPHLLARAGEWNDLHRWERSELGKALRRLGLTYGEIREIIPVPKGTLSYWCSGIRLDEDQVAAIVARTGPESRVGIPVDTQWRRREVIARIRAEAAAYARRHLWDPRFVAGVVLYWAEGSKTRNDLSVANADPAMLRAFIAFVRLYLDGNAEFVLSMHLHEGNDDEAARSYWRDATGLGDVDFTKTYIKPKGTGHRKNHLAHGVCRVRVRRSTDMWNRVSAWTEVVADHLGRLGSTR